MLSSPIHISTSSITIGDHALFYKGCHSSLMQRILLMLVRGICISDISVIENISIKKVLSVPVKFNRIITPKQPHYDCPEVDGFWTYAGNKKNKVRLIYAYHRAAGETVAYVRGKRNCKMAKKMRGKLLSTGIGYDVIYTDKWDSFTAVFKSDNHVVGKENTRGIEGNNCRLRYRIRRAFRKTCCFSKKPYNHFKAFDLVVFYINYGFV
jgi:IS1 family transposase